MRRRHLREDTMGFGERMECCGQFVKYGLFVANFVIFLGGLAVFCLSLWTLIDKSFVNELLGTNLFLGSAYVLIITSLITCMVSFIGCLGAVKEVKCLLMTYFIIVFLLFVTMFIGGILGYVFREQVVTTMRQEMKSSFRLYGSRREVTQAWDHTQERLKCCGVDSWRDWNWYGPIPESCCQETFGGQRKPCVLYPSITNLYGQGCLYVATNYIRNHAEIIGGTAVAVAVLMIFGMIFSVALFKVIE